MRKYGRSNWKLKSGRVYGLDGKRIATIEEVAGSRLKHSVRAGQAITSDMITERREVEPGDTVDVAVTSGAAALRFSARAESGGRLHEKIFVAAPTGGKRLAVVVTAKGKAEIDVDE